MNRQAESTVREYLEYFPCVVVVGSRQAGKTTLLQRVGEGREFFDLERRADFAQIERDPDLFLRLKRQPIAIDEAQLLPDLFPALRVAIDRERGTKGRYLLSGSSSPALMGAISESLAGRVGVIELSPLSFGEVTGALRPNLLQLFEGPTLDTGRALQTVLGWSSTAVTHETETVLESFWLNGGYPEPWVEAHERFAQVWREQYVKSYVERDIARLFPSLNRSRFRRFVELLAGASGSILNYANVARLLEVSEPTARDYFHIAHGTFLWRTLPAYAKAAHKRVHKRPRGYLRDSGLLHHLLHIGSSESLMSHPQLGASWEGVVVEEVLRSLAAAGIAHTAYYYRTAGGAEVDLVVEGAFGLVPIEVKHTSHVSPRHLRSLRDFVADYGCSLGLVINRDDRVRQYGERLVGVPFAVLAGNAAH
jgi:predicted AAA+ superfamily ATPase